jgi:predicted nucleic acid-binding Zn ribbon protein
MVGSAEPVCTVCGKPRDPRKQATCSAACRRALSRQRLAEAHRQRDEEIRGLLGQAERLLAAARTRLEEG